MGRARNSDISRLIQAGGAVTRVLVDYPTDGAEWTVPGPRLRSIIHALAEAGAPEPDIGALTSSLEERSADRTATPRLLLVRDGDLVVDEALPDIDLESNEVSFGLLPELVSLLEQRELAVPYLVVEANAEGGRIRTHLAERGDEGVEATVHGETEHLHEARGGGLSHIGHARHTEEIWKRNEIELAVVVNELVDRHDVELLVVTGDPHVVDLVSTALSSRARSVLSTLASDTLADGASPEELNALVSTRVRAVVAARRAVAIGRASQAAPDGSRREQSFEAVVDALQQAHVEALLLDLDALRSQTLTSLAGAPWVTLPGADTYGTVAVATGPAAEALARAAIVTGAEVFFVEAGSLPEGVGAAIIRR